MLLEDEVGKFSLMVMGQYFCANCFNFQNDQIKLK